MKLAITLAFLALAGPCPLRAHAQDHAGHDVTAGVVEGPPRLIADAPVAVLLARGVVVIPFRTENLAMVPVYGPAALGVVPRVGHLHVTVDGAAWHWVHASADPVVIQGLAPGPHLVLLQLADPTHKILEDQSVGFVVPAPAAAPAKP